MNNLFVLNAPVLQSQLKGKLQRILFEIRQGVFVGKLPKKHILQIIDDIDKCGSSALIVYSAKNEQGFEMKITGEQSQFTVDNYGINLMFKKGK